VRHADRWLLLFIALSLLFVSMSSAPTRPRRVPPHVPVRLGEPPPLAAPKGREVLEGDIQTATLFPLWPVSDTNLRKLGLPTASPARLHVDGRPLARVTDRRMLVDGCLDCFHHMGRAFVFRVEASLPPTTIEVDLDPAFPMIAEDGSPTFWLYPSTTARFPVPGGRLRDPSEVVVDGVALHPHREREGLSVHVGGLAAEFAPGPTEGTVRAEVRVNGGDWPTIEVRSDDPLGFLLIRNVQVTDDRGVTRLVGG
jgi:hypothetical protein